MSSSATPPVQLPAQAILPRQGIRIRYEMDSYDDSVAPLLIRTWGAAGYATSIHSRTDTIPDETMATQIITIGTGVATDYTTSSTDPNPYTSMAERANRTPEDVRDQEESDDEYPPPLELDSDESAPTDGIRGWIVSRRDTSRQVRGRIQSVRLGDTAGASFINIINADEVENTASDPIDESRSVTRWSRRFGERRYTVHAYSENKDNPHSKMILQSIERQRQIGALFRADRKKAECQAKCGTLTLGKKTIHVQSIRRRRMRVRGTNHTKSV